MRPFNLLLITAAILLIQCNKKEDTDTTSSNDAIDLTVDVNTQYQEMDGFGASDAWRCQMIGKYWSVDKKNQIADLLFSQDTDAYGNPKGIGLSLWRFNIGAGSTEQGDESYISDSWRRSECFLNSDGTYDWSKQEGQQWFLKAAKERGVEKILGFTNSPPVYYTSNEKAFSAGGWHINLKSGYTDKFADFLATVADHFNNQGTPIDYLSPVNEPQWNWTASNGYASQEGSPAANDEVANLARSISSKLAAKQLSTKVAVGEAGTLAYLYETTDADRGNQIATFFGSSSSNYIGNESNVAGLISGHSYYTVWPVSDMISTRESVYSKMTSTNNTLKFWQSEYCILESANTDLSDGWDRDLTIQTAMYVARIIHYDIIKARASSWSWWTALSRSDYKDGLIYLDDGTNNGITNTSNGEYCKYDGYIRESKLMWALGNYSRFIRPGMIRIKIGSSELLANQAYGILASAYLDKDNKKVITVILNYSKKANTIAIHLSNASFKTSTIQGYETSENSNLEKTNALDPDKITLPAYSITTLVVPIK